MNWDLHLMLIDDPSLRYLHPKIRSQTVSVWIFKRKLKGETYYMASMRLRDQGRGTKYTGASTSIGVVLLNVLAIINRNYV